MKDLADLQRVQKQVERGRGGAQEIRGDLYESPLPSTQQMELPRSFTFLGQRFALDSWALTKVVVDDILWDNQKVTRRIPSALDMAFSTLDNRSIVPILTARMENSRGRAYRDGLNYQHNLAAVHEVVQRQPAARWEENLYTSWLGALRALSQPMTDSKYPQAMRTKAWAMKTLNTQLASWTELRHDTVLYIKPSFTATMSCAYPAGYVEPVPSVWAKLETLTTGAATLLEKSKYPVVVREYESMRFSRENGKFEKVRIPIELGGHRLQVQHVKFLRRFAEHMAMLKLIAERELQQQELSPEQVKFLQEAMQMMREGSGTTRYGGWYPQLFYTTKTDAGRANPLVTDLHTDPPDQFTADPGCVLHQGVGRIDFLLVAIETRGEWRVYGGGLFSHYEFETPIGVRLTDAEWCKQVTEQKMPPRPEWAKSYLAPPAKPIYP
jgi:hypothetical protein